MTVDDLEAYGMVRMDDDAIHGFLTSQHVGVLALPTADGPLLRPMSFTYDGADGLYLLYVLGGSSRKTAATEGTDAARFLVYRVDTPFNWTSVLLAGTLDVVPESDRDAVREAIETAWRPDLFEQASAGENTRLYRFEIRERTGIRHTGLPQGFEDAMVDDGPE